MASRPPRQPERTYLVECFAAAGGATTLPDTFVATLAIHQDEQLLVLVRSRSEAVARRVCVAAGMQVDRVVEVTVTPESRWDLGASEAHPPARGCPR